MEDRTSLKAGLLHDDHHGHSHDGKHAHGHDEKPSAEAASDAKSARARWQLVAAMIFCFAFMGAEVAGGYFAHSLAIMTDAAHLLSDVAGFLISLFAVWLASRAPTKTHTYGYHRVEILGALASIFVIWILTGVLVYEAVLRIINPEEVDGLIMFVTAAAGIVVNLIMMGILHQGGGHGHSHGGGGDDHGHSHGGMGIMSLLTCSMGGGDKGNINVYAAYIHVVGDLVQSIGVAIAAGVIWAYPAAHIADPICTFLFSILVLFTTFGIMRTGIATLLNTVPPHISLTDIAAELARIPGVANVHDLHIWAFGSDRVAMTVHLVADDRAAAQLAAQVIATKHGIAHSTIQTEQCGSAQVADCYEHNEHIAACALELTAEAVDEHGGHGHDHHGHDHAHSHSHGSPVAVKLDRPAVDTRHTGPGACGSLVSPLTRTASAPNVHSKHGDGEDHHGHSHAAGNNHGHSSGGAPAAEHGHSHAGGHGHSHGVSSSSNSSTNGSAARVSSSPLARTVSSTAATAPVASAHHGHSHASGHGHSHGDDDTHSHV